MQFSTATIALAAAYLLNAGMAAALPVEAGVAVSAPETANEIRSLDKRDQYTHCACQFSSGSGIDSTTTSRVAGYNTRRWTLDTVETPRYKYGAAFTGFYVYANKGYVDGTAFYNECRQNGAGDSTCFGCH